METDMHKHMDAFRSLLPQLRAGEIAAIEFGEKNMPMGFMSHHRLQIVRTPAGDQLCFKLVLNRMLSSGHYLAQAEDRELEIHAQSLLEQYFRPTPLREKLRELRTKTKSTPPVLEYFAVQHGEE